jgi:site-specific recombinase XerD
MSNLALSDALNLFAESLSKKGKSTNTIVAYKGDINQLIGFLAKSQINSAENIQSKEIESFKKDLTDNGYTAKSVSRKLNSIKNFLAF